MWDTSHARPPGLMCLFLFAGRPGVSRCDVCSRSVSVEVLTSNLKQTLPDKTCHFQAQAEINLMSSSGLFNDTILALLDKIIRVI